MPLHLLGKKSWNVYNPASIARVRADEAAEAARVEEEERLLDEYDAARRLAILRGVTPPASPPRVAAQSDSYKRFNTEGGSERRDRHREKRRRGEDDTDRDLRLAREQLDPSKDEISVVSRHKKHKQFDAPIVDCAGHIQLFAPPKSLSARGEKNADAEAERKKKEREFEHQYTMRFSNAAGIGHNALQKPWYSGTQALESGDVDEPGLNAFGKPDDNRKNRDQARLQSSDPLAAMRAGQRKLKEVAKERNEWKRERDRETRTLEWGHRRRMIIDEEIDEFSLDAEIRQEPLQEKDDIGKRHHRHKSHRSHRHREEYGDDSQSSILTWSRQQRDHRRDKPEDYHSYTKSARRRSRSP